jgi:Bacterial Ig domain
VRVRSYTANRVTTVPLVVFAFLLPVALYLWLISADAVDWLRADQWYDVRLIEHPFRGPLGLTALWGQHAENRIFFQNLITLGIAHVAHYNVIVEEYVSASLLLGATTLFILTHHRRSPSTRWIAYWPAAIIFLTIAQYGNSLYGFQIGWYIIMAALAVTLWFLDRPTLTWSAFFLAVTAGVIGSYSSLQGLFLWPVGLVLLLQRARYRSFVLAWTICAVVTAGIYFYDWNPDTGGSVSYAIHHPFATLKFFVFAIGDVIGVQVPYGPHGSQDGVFVLGFLILGVVVWLLVKYGFKVDVSSARPVGLALVWFGLIFAAAISGSRVQGGLQDAGDARYVTFDLLILAGSYLTILDQPQGRVASEGGRARLAFRIVTAAVAFVVCLQIILGTVNGINGARSYRNYELTGAVVTVHINQAPDGLVESQLGALYQTAASVRALTGYVRQHRLSLFSGSTAWLSEQSLPVNRTPPMTSILSPTNGQTLRGNVFLFATASNTYGINSVRFVVSANGAVTRAVGKGFRTSIGWLGAWNTRTVPNGSYALRSIAYAPGGQRGASAPRKVEVDN